MVHAPTNLLLIGLRACGKTSAARPVADALGWSWVDLDDHTAARLGAATPAEALDQSGLDAFRAAEAEVLAEALRSDHQVIALGGGTPTAPGAADLIARARNDRTAHVAYLRVGPETLVDRLAQTDLDNRPSLTGAGVLDEVADLYDARDPLYRALADTTIQVDTLSIGQTVARLIALIDR